MRKPKSKTVIITLRFEVGESESFEWIAYKNSVKMAEQAPANFVYAMNSLVVTLSDPANQSLFGDVPKALVYPVVQFEGAE